MSQLITDRERPLEDFAMPEAERAANALAKLFKKCSQAERARMFGSGNPSKRVIHRTKPVIERGSASGPAARLREMYLQRAAILRELRLVEDRAYIGNAADQTVIDTMANLRSSLTEIEDRIQPIQRALDMLRDGVEAA